jgi:hypothetical protein
VSIVKPILLALASMTGCAWPPHAHDHVCGHAYLQDVHLSPVPGDFSGADAWRGPRWENEIRWG